MRWPRALLPHKAVLHIHEIPEGAMRRILVGLMHWSHADLIFNSRATRAAFGEPKTARTHVVYNGVAGPAAVEPTTYDGKRPLRVLLLGRINRIKGQEVLLEAIASMPAELQSRIEVRLVGGAFESTERERALAELVETMGLTGRVSVLPFIPDPSEHYRWADIVTVPSRRPESLGRVAIEAMAYGRPPLVSAIGGLVEVVSDGETGWHVPPGDAAALGAKLQEIILAPEAWRGFVAAGRARYEAIFSEPVAAAAIAAIAADKLKTTMARPGRARRRPPSGDTPVKFAFPSHLVRRLVLMIGGEAMQSGFHFALNIMLLHLLSAQGYGLFAIGMVMGGVGLSYIRSLTAVPASIWMSKSTNSAGVDAYDVAFGTAALIVALLMAVGTAVLMHLLGDPSGIAAGCFVGAWSLRSHMRTAFFARRQQVVVSISDGAFTIAGIVLTGLTIWKVQDPLQTVFYALAAANVFGIFVLVRLARRYTSHQLPHADAATLYQALAPTALVGIQRDHHQHPGSMPGAAGRGHCRACRLRTAGGGSGAVCPAAHHQSCFRQHDAAGSRQADAEQ
jgi:hypothetical protein